MSESENIDLPTARLSSATKYWWTCTRCNFTNENAFLGEVPKTMKCGACELEHEMTGHK